MRFEEYEGKTKDERRITASEDESLEVKRFILSRNPEVQERLRVLREVFKELQGKYPEIISLSLYGSLTKGYATEDSDIDAFLHINGEIEKHEYSKEELYELFVDIVREKLKLNKAQVENIKFDALNKKEIEEDCRKGFVDERTPIFRLFLLSIDRDINEYRRVVFDTLESMGKKGENLWMTLMTSVSSFENHGLDDGLESRRGKLYPQTLAEGRKYFLGNSN